MTHVVPNASNSKFLPLELNYKSILRSVKLYTLIRDKLRYKEEHSSDVQKLMLNAL